MSFQNSRFGSYPSDTSKRQMDSVGNTTITSDSSFFSTINTPTPSAPAGISATGASARGDTMAGLRKNTLATAPIASPVNHTYHNHHNHHNQSNSTLDNNTANYSQVAKPSPNNIGATPVAVSSLNSNQYNQNIKPMPASKFFTSSPSSFNPTCVLNKPAIDSNLSKRLTITGSIGLDSTKPSTHTAVPTGSWESPVMKTIRSKLVNTELATRNVLVNVILVLVVRFVYNSFHSKLGVAESSSVSGSTHLEQYTYQYVSDDQHQAVNPLLINITFYLFNGLQFLFVFNIIMNGYKILKASHNNFDDVKMTASQRKLLDLPESSNAKILQASDPTESPPKYEKGKKPFKDSLLISDASPFLSGSSKPSFKSILKSNALASSSAKVAESGANDSSLVISSNVSSRPGTGSRISSLIVNSGTMPLAETSPLSGLAKKLNTPSAAVPLNFTLHPTATAAGTPATASTPATSVPGEKPSSAPALVSQASFSSNSTSIAPGATGASVANASAVNATSNPMGSMLNFEKSRIMESTINPHANSPKTPVTKTGRYKYLASTL